MHTLFLPAVAEAEGGPHAAALQQLQASGLPIPGMMRLTAFKPDQSWPMIRFVQAVMRGPSPLSPGLRELIAAFVSRRNACVF